eukprot:TRINITY_DN3320_c2_g6_i1.p2 TRINITY_DN3320_c2_g6~~TRINITY_DN3320_c2_g6_i1.p2  ORF type:complete len:67 (+),score=2.72 TRINITY_DN3320_c2_g6_i1:185-385(+)
MNIDKVIKNTASETCRQVTGNIALMIQDPKRASRWSEEAVVEGENPMERLNNLVQRYQFKENDWAK